MIDARVIPLAIDRYQPVPVAGAVATRVIRLMDARSALTAYSDRIQPRVTESIIDPHRTANAVITDTGMTGEITTGRDVETVSYRLDSAGQAALPPCALVRTDSFAGEPNAEVGVDLMQWGDLDDVTADDDRHGGSQWVLNGNATVESDGDNQYLRVQPTRVRGATVRQIARSATPLHRWYGSDLKPVDGEPKYTVQLRTRGKGVAGAKLRVATYDVDDTDPTTEPVSTLLREYTIALAVPDSDEWTETTVDVTTTLDRVVGQLRPNAVLLYVDVPRKSSRLDIDDVRLMEWRDVREVPDGVWAPAVAARGTAGAELTVEQSGCIAHPSQARG